VSKKRYSHDYVDGELVRDLEQELTFVFTDRYDGFRAQMEPAKLRRANQAEKDVFAEYKQPDRP